MNGHRLYVTYGSDAKEMALELMRAAHVAVDIPAGASVALKPNLVTASPAAEGATTHPELVAGCIEYLREHGIRDISIMESSWVGANTARAFERCGLRELSERYGVPLYDLKRDAAKEVQTPIGPLRVCERALNADYLITLPVLKGHCQTRITCALKNSKGYIPDAEKRRFHALGLHRPIAALAVARKPDLCIVDSICGDLNFEEGGTPVPTMRMFLGRDPVMVDAYGCRLMGIDAQSIEYLRLAEAWGVGNARIDEADIVMLRDPSAAPAFPRPSGLVSSLTRNVTQASACSACFGNLVHALYRLRELDPGFNEKISIGQGFRGRAIDGIGIGRCCAGAKCSVPGCPPDAEAILRALLRESEH